MTNQSATDAINAVIAGATAPGTKHKVCPECGVVSEHDAGKLPPASCPDCGKPTAFRVMPSRELAEKLKSGMPKFSGAPAPTPTPITPSERLVMVMQAELDEQIKRNNLEAEAQRARAAQVQAVPTAEVPSKPARAPRKPKPVEAPPETVPVETTEAGAPVIPISPVVEELPGHIDAPKSASAVDWQAKRDAATAQLGLNSVETRVVGSGVIYARGFTRWHEIAGKRTPSYSWMEMTDTPDSFRHALDTARLEDPSIAVDAARVVPNEPVLATLAFRGLLDCSLRDAKGLPIRVQDGDKVTILAKLSASGRAVFFVRKG